MIHNLTSSRSYSLRVDLEDSEEETRYALYGQFAVGAEDDGFRLTVGDYTGDAGKIDVCSQSYDGPYVTTLTHTSG